MVDAFSSLQHEVDDFGSQSHHLFSSLPRVVDVFGAVSQYSMILEKDPSHMISSPLFKTRWSMFFFFWRVPVSRQHEQHLRIVMKSLQIVYWKTRRPRSDNLMLRQGGCWNKSHVWQMGIMNSQRWFSFSWIALTARPSHQLHSFRSENNLMHSNDNQTLSLRVVDPIADDGVWAIYWWRVQQLLSRWSLATKRWSEDESFGPSPYLDA